AAMRLPPRGDMLPHFLIRCASQGKRLHPNGHGPMLTRRALLAGLAAAAVSCRRERPGGLADTPSAAPTAPPSALPPPPSAPDRAATRTLAFGRDQGGPQRAVLVV